MMADDDYVEKLERGEYNAFTDPNSIWQRPHIVEQKETVWQEAHIMGPEDIVKVPFLSPFDESYWRKMYAGMAMQGLMADWKNHFDGFHVAKAVQSISKLSVQAADALVEELKKEKQ